jgi:hypothetical protein
MKQVRTKIAELGFPPGEFNLMESPDGIMIKPVRYLGKDWRQVNTTLRSIGASWVRGGGCWSLPYYRAPQLVWRYRRTYHSRRRLRSVSERVAEKCHISTREAVSEVIPLLKVIYKEDSEMAQDLSSWLELDEKESGWLSS